jgi:molybdopterin molybdotransferase
MTNNGVEILFSRLSIKPGKPTTFGITKDNKFVFGLPGNPVSTFILFELFVKPFIYFAMGHKFKAKTMTVKCTTLLKRKNVERVEYIPVSLTDGFCEPVRYKGSGHIAALANADAIIRFDIGVYELKENEDVVARLI